MGKNVLYTLITGLIATLFLSLTSVVRAESTAGISARLISANSESTIKDREAKKSLVKKITIKKVLEKYNSPFINEAGYFIEICQKYNLDCYLLPSITGLESGFGHYIWPESNNPFGWGRGLTMFKDWKEAIDTVGKGLKENYIDKGAKTVEEIGAIYCEGNTWSGKIRYFMNEFIAEEEKNQLLFPVL